MVLLFKNLALLSLSISASFAQFNNGTSTWGCVFQSSDQLDICTSDKPSICCTLSNETASAWGVFSDGIKVIPAAGWSQLAIHTSSSFPELLQAQAAGFLEGYLTASRSFEFITNVHNGVSTWSPSFNAFLK